jgi:DNA-binding CsgD family transcriptional regulator
VKCPSSDCGGTAFVTSTRHGTDCVKRIRRCNLCGLRFETREIYADGDRPERRHIDAPVLHPDLSGRESEVLELLAQGRTNQEIGAELGISPHTVKQHVGHVFAKLGVRSRVEAATWAIRHAELAL